MCDRAELVERRLHTSPQQCVAYISEQSVCLIDRGAHMGILVLLDVVRAVEEITRDKPYVSRISTSRFVSSQ
jgi:predicted phosphoribosyltransferase